MRLISMQLPLKIYTIFLFLVGVLFLNFTVDDAFITFRYGKNLVEHGVWNWNPSGNNVVEAYTNPLYAGFSVIPHWLNFNVIYLFKIIGIYLLFLTYFVLSRNLVNELKWYCAAFIATNMMIFPHAFSGLETIAFFCTAFYLMTLDDEQLKKLIPSFLIFVAPLIRPEGALLSIYIIYRQLILGRMTTLAKVAVVLGLFYFSARYIYFGNIFPNTFYAKSGSGLATFIANVRGDIEVICGWLIAFIFTLKYKGRKTLPIILFLGYLFANMTAVLQMNYAYRFAWHMLFPAIFYAFWLSVRSNEDEVKNSTHFTIPILFLLAVMLNFSPSVNIFSGITYYQKIERSHKALGEVLSKYNKHKPILAVGDAGLIPYYSGMETIDYVGLANTEITRAIREKRQPKLPEPDILILYSHKEYGCIPAEYDHAKLGVTALINAISDKDYACIAGPDAAGSFYLNILVKRNFYAYSDLIEDIADVKKKSSDTIRAKDAIFLPGLR